jgi:hypothetical protein
MAEQKLSDSDREIMTSRGWNPDSEASVAKYQELRAKVQSKGIDEKELNRRMNNFELEQHIKGVNRGPENAVGIKPPNRGDM